MVPADEIVSVEIGGNTNAISDAMSDPLCMVARRCENVTVWQKFMCWLHVKMCRECASFIQQYQKVIKFSQSAFDAPDDDPLPDSVPEELIKAALAYRNAKLQ